MLSPRLDSATMAFAFVALALIAACSSPDLPTDEATELVPSSSTAATGTATSASTGTTQTSTTATTSSTPAPATSLPERPEAPAAVRGLRVSRYVASMPDQFSALLDQAEASSANALVFDTKDETGQVLYQTQVATARRLGSVEAVYDPVALLAEATSRGLYPITRIVTFEDVIWSQDPEAKLAGNWVNAADSDNWEYPLELAAEACELGFAEIQFDYVRFPAGQTAKAASAIVPATGQERSEVIASFLAQARTRLQPLGCRTSAAVFGITMSGLGDEGIGQQLEAVAPHVDALSPMVYPSHYNSGWLGLDDPNEHPGPVMADALDDAIRRLDVAGIEVELRPWAQAFYYDGAQIAAQLVEAETRGAGWLLWNASGNYREGWLPAGPLS